MYYRYILQKNHETSGLFHPLDNWSIPKKGGLYEIVPVYFSSLNYHKGFSSSSESWFTEEGNTRYHTGIMTLTAFYTNYGIHVQSVKKQTLVNIIRRESFQVWIENNI